MSSLLDSVMDQLGGSNLQQLSQAVGADEGTTRNALSAALPMILAGLAKNASRPEGAAALNNALAKDHDGGLLDNLSGFLGEGNASPGEAILGHVFGDRKPAVAKGVSKTSGIDAAQAAKLLAMAAPLVMAYLGKQRRQKQLDPGALGQMLEHEQQEIQRKAPELGGLGRMLDSDGDGSIGDDIISGLGKLLRR